MQLLAQSVDTAASYYSSCYPSENTEEEKKKGEMAGSEQFLLLSLSYGKSNRVSLNWGNGVAEQECREYSLEEEEEEEESPSFLYL